MTRRFSLLIAWGCLATMVLVPIGVLYFAIDLNAFKAVAQSSLQMPIQWRTVTPWQWYSLWALTLAYVSIGLVGLYFLRRAFANFARGQWFTLANSRDLRRFSCLLFAQAVADPLHKMVASLLLSLNHPAGERILSISLGTQQFTTVGLAMILWVTSDLLVKGGLLETENRAFV